MKRFKRAFAMIFCVLLCMFNVMPMRLRAKEDDDEFIDWDALIKDPHYTVEASYGMYRYDELQGKMVQCTLNDRKNIAEVGPLGIVLYDNETGELLARQTFLPAFDFEKEIYLNAFPNDSTSIRWAYDYPSPNYNGNEEYYAWLRSGELKKEEKIYEDWSKTEERYFEESYSASELIEAGYKYGTAEFHLQYWFDVKIVSPAYWPIEYVENTGGIARDADQDYYDYLVRSRRSEESKGIQYYETTLAGRRTFVIDETRDVQEHLETTMYGDDEDVDIPYTLTSKGGNKRYYVVNEMPDVPGFYAVIQVFIGDFYFQSMADGPGTTPTEVLQIMNDHNYYQSLLTDRLLNDLASMNIGGTLTSEVFSDVIIQESSTTALEESGEDEGTELYNEIVDGKKQEKKVDKDDSDEPESESVTPGEVAGAVGCGVLAVGIAGLVTARGRGKKEGEDRKKGKYKMYVQKDFGDAIRKGDPPVIVRTRMVEVDEEGKEKDREDLSKKIQATCLGLSLKGTSFAGRYLEATVYADKDAGEQSGSVTFHLTGPGGVFSNKVLFRIIGEPRIVFPALSEDGASWDLSSNLNELEMVAGMGGQGVIRFVIMDASEEPKEIKFLNADGFSILAVKDEVNAFTYYAKVTDHTEKMEKESGIFASFLEREITILAEFSDGRSARGSFVIQLYPDGISVEADHKKIVDGRLRINTNPNQNASGDAAQISATRFAVTVCRLDDDGSAIILKNPSLQFGDLDDDGKYLNTFKGQFEYRIDHLGSSGFQFAPKSSLPTILKPYEVKLPIEYVKGFCCKGELPISFLGLEPVPPSQIEKEEAIEKLKETIRVFGLGSEDKQLQEMVRTAREHSAAEIEYTRRQVLLAAKKYYDNESKEYARIADVFDRYVVVAGGLVTAGDYAIEVILSRCLGSVGKATAKFVNPLKNMIATTIGEFIANGKEFSEEEFWKAYRTGIYDAIEQTLSDAKPSAEKVGYVVAGYLLLRFTRHYYDGKGKEKGDVYRSIIAAFYDLTFESFKEWIGEWISKGTGKLWDKVQSWFSESFKKAFTASIEKTVKSAGFTEFVNQVREAYKKDGTLTNAEYALIKKSQAAMTAIQKEQAMKILPGLAAKAGEKGLELTKIGLAQVVNYFLGGKENGTEGLGTTPEGVIQEYLMEKLSKCLEENIDSMNDVLEWAMPGIYYSNGTLTVSCFDETLDVALAEISQRVIDGMFEYCFSWLEELWNVVMPDQESLPDKRDEISEDTSQLDRQLERL